MSFAKAIQLYHSQSRLSLLAYFIGSFGGVFQDCLLLLKGFLFSLQYPFRFLQTQSSILPEMLLTDPLIAGKCLVVVYENDNAELRNSILFWAITGGLYPGQIRSNRTCKTSHGVRPREGIFSFMSAKKWVRKSQIRKLQKDWICKSQIRKLPLLRKVCKSVSP